MKLLSAMMIFSFFSISFITGVGDAVAGNKWCRLECTGSGWEKRDNGDSSRCIKEKTPAKSKTVNVLCKPAIYVKGYRLSQKSGNTNAKKKDLCKKGSQTRSVSCAAVGSGWDCKLKALNGLDNCECTKPASYDYKKAKRDSD